MSNQDDDDRPSRESPATDENGERESQQQSGRDQQEQIAQPESPEVQAETSEKDEKPIPTSRLAVLALGALGVSYGDIGTSPLYALRECFHGASNLEPSNANVLGVLSLIFWALLLIVSVKYMLFVTRANNNGEGGMLALVALLNPWRTDAGPHSKFLLKLGVFGTALLYGSFMLTPAISVSSAVEGLTVATPAFEPYVIPITIVILVLLFLIQSRGTGTVGALFGPIMIAWFATLGTLGVYGILHEPDVLRALNPLHAVAFFVDNRGVGFVALGAIFLVVTGGEALYADMGHFGRRPITLAWFVLVLPALLLNYYGQGAMILHSEGASVSQPFYQLAPGWALYPLVALATVATVIASQAVISGGFSLTRQAVQLGQLPRMRLLQTSSEEYGQIYVPTLNWLLMLATIGLVIGFGSSSNLAWAYGVGISFAMTITTIMAFFIMRERWAWPLWVALSIAGAFLLVDLPFFGANLFKIPHGGWFPLATAVVMFTIMSTWRRGRDLLRTRLTEDDDPVPLEDFLQSLGSDDTVRVPGTAIFLVGDNTGTPPMLLHHLEHNRALHKQVLLMTIRTEDVPRIPAAERLQIEDLGQGLYRVYARYGFMQNPNVPVAVRLTKHFGIDIGKGDEQDSDLKNVTFYVGRATIVPTDEVPGMMLWREKLYAFMARNSIQPTAYYNVPPERVVELGQRVEI